MNVNVYGGDEVGALIFDFGHHSLRAGYAGEDMPKADIPTMVGVDGELIETIDPEITSTTNLAQNKYYFGTNSIRVPRKDMELKSFLTDGMIEDWDLFENVLDYIYSQHIRSEPQMHPVLMSEPAWNVRAKREKISELMFEKYKIPAFYMSKNAVLAAFANGRSTGLVIDSGDNVTSAVPIIDGFVLTQGIVKSPLAGDFISRSCKEYLQDCNIDIIPPCLIASKEAVKKTALPKWVMKTNIAGFTKSWKDYMVKEVLHDFKSTVLQVYESENEKDDDLPSIHYEFPNGYNQDFGLERFHIPEALFNPSSNPSLANQGKQLLGAAQVVATSIGKCDIDVRNNLFGAVIVTGGNTLIQGYTERLNHEISSKVPSNMRFKMISPNGTTERRFASWIGGSILASLGNFQQLWISKQEYDEHGKGQIDRKCP